MCVYVRAFMHVKMGVLIVYSSLQDVAIAGLTAGALFFGAIPAAVYASNLNGIRFSNIGPSTGAVAVSS